MGVVVSAAISLGEAAWNTATSTFTIITKPVAPIVDAVTGQVLDAADTLGVTTIAGQLVPINPKDVLPGGKYYDMVKQIPQLVSQSRQFTTNLGSLGSNLTSLSNALSGATQGNLGSVNAQVPPLPQAYTIGSNSCGQARTLGKIMFPVWKEDIAEMNNRGFTIGDWYVKDQMANVTGKLCWGQPDVPLYTFGSKGFAKSAIPIPKNQMSQASSRGIETSSVEFKGDPNWGYIYPRLGPSLDRSNVLLHGGADGTPMLLLVEGDTMDMQNTGKSIGTYKFVTPRF